jgi:hypothetical protein
MSGISALQVPGLGTVPSAKPVTGAVVQAPINDVGTAAAPVSTPNYPSPILAIDPLANRVIIEYRDEKSGTVTQQIPPKDAVLLYQQAAAGATATGPGSSTTAA